MLFRYRTLAGLSQRDLARRSGLSERAVRDLERGTAVRPRWQSVRALADALTLTGSELSVFTAAAGSAGGGAELVDRAVPAPLPDGLVGRGAELHALTD